MPKTKKKVTKNSVKKKEPVKRQKAEPLAKTQVKEEVCEIFDVEKKGEEEKEIKSCGIETEKNISSPDQMKKQTKMFKIIIITMMGFVILFLGVLWLISYLNHFSVGGVIFEIDKTDMIGKTLYKTSVPVAYKDGTTGEIIATKYNFYLRNDPRTLIQNIPIRGNITFRQNVVLDVTTKDLFCDGYWNVAIGNMQNLYPLFKMKLLVKNESEKYQPAENYMFITINKGNQTEIKQIDDNHYEINVNNCEILPAAERLMTETFIKYNS